MKRTDWYAIFLILIVIFGWLLSCNSKPVEYPRTSEIWNDGSANDSLTIQEADSLLEL